MYKYFTRKTINSLKRLRPALGNSQQEKRFEKKFLMGETIDQAKQAYKEDYIEYIRNQINDSGLFDSKYYLVHNKDVKKAGVDPLKHYILYGGKEGRNPSSKFDHGFYFYKNPNKAHEITNPLIDHIRSVKNKQAKSGDYSEKAKKKLTKSFQNKVLEASKKYTSLVVMESMSWDDMLQQRPHHIARLLAHNGILVIYIDRSSLYPRKITKNLYVVNEFSYIKQLQKSPTKHKYLWLFSTQPFISKDLKEIISKKFDLIYDYIDDFHETISGNLKNQLENFNSLEELKPKILIASAKKLYGQLQERFPKEHILFCPNAVDMTHFNFEEMKKDKVKPKDLQKIIAQKKPIVGYYGAIAPWLDYKLINDLTERRKDLSFVFIGLDYNKGLSKLNIRKNVHFLGPKAYDSLAQYSYWFDCAIIPFKKGDIAKATSPVKLFEYMAMAIPTVCTRDLYECVGFKHVYISKDSKEFESNIDLAIQDKRAVDTRVELIKQAELNTWQARTKLIADRIYELSENRIKR